MRNVKLTLEYDGTDFSGSQLQANSRTVQGELEKAIAKLIGMLQGERCIVTLAGRTDSGVHAKGQVANFRTDSLHSLNTFRRGLNALLPYDLAICHVEEVEESFHARFDATERVYHYQIINRSARSPLVRRFAHFVAEPLTVGAMNEATQKLVGTHDFASFAGDGWGVGDNEASDEKGKFGTIRQIHQAVCWQEPDSPIITLELRGNAFLPHMVRNIVGTLLMVGVGRLTLAEFEGILAACNRRRAGPTAPAVGLCLVKVRYDKIVF